MGIYPPLQTVRQNFPPSTPIDIGETLRTELSRLAGRVKSGDTIGVGVGSRGITNQVAILRGTLEILREFGAKPFLMPAMGSHGGATPAGQRGILASYGVTEESMGAPIRDSLDVRQLGETPQGAPVYCSNDALDADGVLLVNRVKPHTDFIGPIGSGLLKMSVIGLGKRHGAAAMHASASRMDYEPVLRGMAEVLIDKAPLLGGVAILEDHFHQTARLSFVVREEMLAAEEGLHAQARSLMPLLPFNEIDLLIVDRIGKNISGVGIDPNVTGRGVHGYSSALGREERPSPFIRRIFVRELTPETHGNALGIGLADFTTTRLVESIDRATMYTNSLTALTPQNSKIPIYFDSDREAIGKALDSLAIEDLHTARIARIRDTLNLHVLEVSPSLLASVADEDKLSVLTGPREMSFDEEGNLLPLASEA
ncbi:hypothetical protein Pan216_07350 [Planctomycetes bacterium Pan216]|uniref:LarA-like N-terminal domain-containing protein n=1 Tax=Kolteria novifilia TaxID=2527975 RepID=A0A518AYW7_9BACT|nr:hypothetical protein Pan216_07350 [Planctomycetes bacterium Pan216]